MALILRIDIDTDLAYFQDPTVEMRDRIALVLMRVAARGHTIGFDDEEIFNVHGLPCGHIEWLMPTD